MRNGTQRHRGHAGTTAVAGDRDGHVGHSRHAAATQARGRGGALLTAMMRWWTNKCGAPSFPWGG